MNVLLTHERFLPDFGGGGEHIIYETARHLQRRGVHVRVLTTGDPQLTSYDGIPTQRLPVHRYRLNGAIRPIVEAARTADLIHTCTYHAALPSLLAGRWLGKPVVCQVLALFHRGWTDMRGKAAGRLLIAWEQFLVTRNFARTMFLSEYSRDLGIALGVAPERALVHSPGIELPKYRPAHDKEQVVLFVGKLERRKGVDDLLDVASRLPDVRFRVIGWGPEVDRVRHAGPNVEYVGFREGDPLRAEFGRASIFLCPSRAETFGLVLAEAMASGCAIVSTIPLPLEGIHVPAGDRDAMTAAIRRLWNDPADAARMGGANVELARVYTWQRYTDALLNTYAEVMRERGHDPLAAGAPSPASTRSW